MEAKYFSPEVDDTRAWRLLDPGEYVVVEPDHPPLLTAHESFNTFGLFAPLKLMIGASRLKRFYVFDLSTVPCDQSFEDDGRPANRQADYLLTEDGMYGYKTLRARDGWVRIGRWHMYNRFSYPNTVSRDHFMIATDQSRRLYLSDLYPENKTALCMTIPRTS